MWTFRLDTVHSAMVHFPIALLILALFFEVLARLLKSDELSRVAVWNLIFGALGALVAAATGILNSDMVHHTRRGHELMQLHEKLGLAVTAVAVLLLAIRLAQRGTWLGKLKPIFLLLYFMLVGTLAYTGMVGSWMVYDEGVAVYCIPAGIHEHADGEEAMPHYPPAKDSICTDEVQALMEKAEQADRMKHDSPPAGGMTMPMEPGDQTH